jgi:hypothetical protein
MLSFKFWKTQQKTDEALVAELAGIVQSPYWTSWERRAMTILYDMHNRLAANANEHPSLAPVAKELSRVEPYLASNWYHIRERLAKRVFGNPWAQVAHQAQPREEAASGTTPFRSKVLK